MRNNAPHRNRTPIRRTLLVSVAAVALIAAAVPASAAAISSTELGNYCSTTGPGTGFNFASTPNGGDPCAAILKENPGAKIQRKGLYANNATNRVVSRCNPPGFGDVGLYEGSGNGPLTAAFNAAQGKPGCIFTVSPKTLRIFDSPFKLTTKYVHATGFDFAKSPFNTLNVGEFGQPGSGSARIVDWKGRDKTIPAGRIDDHDGHDWLMPKGTPIVAMANGKVVMARTFKSRCKDSDSRFQQEIAIEHNVRGRTGYRERFLTYYAHFSAMKVKVGAMVDQGEVIGLAGNTGCSSGSHLHLGVVRLTNTSDRLSETANFFTTSQHSENTDNLIEPYGWAASQGFDPWAWKAYPAGALSVNLWKSGQAPSTDTW